MPELRTRSLCDHTRRYSSAEDTIFADVARFIQTIFKPSVWGGMTSSLRDTAVVISDAAKALISHVAKYATPPALQPCSKGIPAAQPKASSAQSITTRHPAQIASNAQTHLDLVLELLDDDLALQLLRRREEAVLRRPFLGREQDRLERLCASPLVSSCALAAQGREVATYLERLEPRLPPRLVQLAEHGLAHALARAYGSPVGVARAPIAAVAEVLRRGRVRREEGAQVRLVRDDDLRCALRERLESVRGGGGERAAKGEGRNGHGLARVALRMDADVGHERARLVDRPAGQASVIRKCEQLKDAWKRVDGRERTPSARARHTRRPGA